MIQNPVHLTPDTPALDGMTLTDQHLTLHLHTTTPAAICPTCQQPTAQVHSRYQRTLQDTAWGACLVQLRLTVRRFRCANPALSLHRLHRTLAPRCAPCGAPHHPTVPRA
jgi:hypothetical protein